MKILITIPALNPPHGGLRVLIEWANWLSKHHEVVLYSQAKEKCDWKKISSTVNIVYKPEAADCVIIGSPHAIELQHKLYYEKVFIFAQMAEHLFRPKDRSWYRDCLKFYQSHHPMLSISSWNIEAFRDLGRSAETHYIRNGINLIDFPIEEKNHSDKVILVEGWEPGNPSKDHEYLGARVAQTLKKDGYRIIAYSQIPLKEYDNVPDEYYLNPSQEKLNDLYRRATIMIKASVYDARSCAPIEAMTKGTVTVRAIDKGDDDLVSMKNCVRCSYDYDQLLNATKALLDRPEVIKQLSKNCLSYVKSIDWEKVMPEINEILIHEKAGNSIL